MKGECLLCTIFLDFISATISNVCVLRVYVRKKACITSQTIVVTERKTNNSSQMEQFIHLFQVLRKYRSSRTRPLLLPASEQKRTLHINLLFLYADVIQLYHYFIESDGIISGRCYQSSAIEIIEYQLYVSCCMYSVWH